MREIHFQYSLRRAAKMRNNMTSLSPVAGPSIFLSYCSISMYIAASVSLIMPSRQKLPALNEIPFLPAELIIESILNVPFP